MKIKIAAAQMEIVPYDFKRNSEKIELFMGHASARKANFICLPECCWVGPDYVDKSTNETAEKVKERVPKLCRKYNLYCIAGTVLEKHDHPQHTHYFSYLISPEGKIIGRYAKRHLVPDVEINITPGEPHRTFETEYGKIGIQICRDILYPETTQVMANLGAKIIFSPAFWSKFSTQFPSSLKDFHANDELQTIKYTVPSRALENEVIFVFANAAGTYETPKRRDVLLGYTQICQPFAGPTECLRHNKEKLLITNIDTDTVDIARKGWKIRAH